MSSPFVRFGKQGVVWCLVLIGLLGVARTIKASDVEQWGVWEKSLKGSSEGNPYLDVQFSATFRQDGNRTYKVEMLDPWEMTVTAAGTANPGSYPFTSAKGVLIYRFTPQ